MIELRVAGVAPLPIGAVVFDAYGTLLDVHSALRRVLAEHAGAAAHPLAGASSQPFSLLWRDKQLAYTWLRNAMRAHADFAQVTADALDHALATFGLGDATELRSALLAAYRRLDAYPEVPPALSRLAATGLPLAVLSNGTPGMLQEGLEAAGIARHLAAVISVEEIGVFKPAPEVYALATRHFGITAREVLFLSANGWDVHGAATFGCTVIHVDRQGAVAEGLPGAPTLKIADLGPLPGLLGQA